VCARAAVHLDTSPAELCGGSSLLVGIPK
jgi:hypothetical protein